MSAAPQTPEMSRRLRRTDEQLFRARMGEALAAPERLGREGF